MIEAGPPVLVRKAFSAAKLGRHLLRRATMRARNVGYKKWRHWTIRTVWAWKSAAEWQKNTRRATFNLARKAILRVWNTRKILIRAQHRGKRASEVFALRREEWSVEREVRRLAGSGRPLVLGPWISEVGFEVLYWIPFLQWLKEEHGWDPASVVAISRGGVASWYADLACTYVEILDHMTPGDFARRNETRREAAAGIHKQLAFSDLDEDLIRIAIEQSGLEHPAIIHPAAMYQLFRRFWLGHRPIRYVEERTRFPRRHCPTRFDLSDLPRDYVAIKTYTAQSLPDSPATRRTLRSLVSRLASASDVVTLETGLAVDDHEDYAIGHEGRVWRLDNLLTPQNNLELQTQIIAGARIFVGTCGSLTWLAPLLGVPTVALFSDTRFLRAHLYFARHVYSASGAANFATVDVSALPHLDPGTYPPSSLAE